MNKLANRRGAVLLWALLLPAGFYWFVGAVIYTTALGWGLLADMACMDCTFRGHGAGGRF